MNIKNVVVIGSGTMGSGIAAQLCNANISVTLLDLKTEIFHEKDNENGKIVIYYKNLRELDSFCSKIMKTQ